MSGGSQNLSVGCCIDRSTSSAGAVVNFLMSIVLLWITMGLHFYHYRGFVLFGWGSADGHGLAAIVGPAMVGKG